MEKNVKKNRFLEQKKLLKNVKKIKKNRLTLKEKALNLSVYQKHFSLNADYIQVIESRLLDLGGKSSKFLLAWLNGRAADL